MSISKTKDNFSGTLLKFSLESQPGCFDALNLCGTREKITINCKGKAFLTTTDTCKSLASSGKWYRTTIFVDLVNEIFAKLTRAFVEPQLYLRMPDCGCWTLKMYNFDREIFTFYGDIHEECFTGADEISRLIRLAFCHQQLLCFDGAIKRYTYLSVIFEGSKKKYYYLTDNKNISVGDKVIVTVAGEEKVVQVVKVEQFCEDELPIPLDQVKYITGTI